LKPKLGSLGRTGHSLPNREVERLSGEELAIQTVSPETFPLQQGDSET